MFRFFPCRSKQYASYVELQLTTTSNDIFGILHLKTVVKLRDLSYFGINILTVTTLRSKFTGVKAGKCQIKL